LFGRNVDKAKVEVRIEWKIFLWKHLKIFMLQFGLVWNLRMFWRFFQCSCLNFLWISSFSFGDMNNVPRQLVKFH
jgi:hypothetical protein